MLQPTCFHEELELASPRPRARRTGREEAIGKTPGCGAARIRFEEDGWAPHSYDRGGCRAYLHAACGSPRGPEPRTSQRDRLLAGGADWGPGGPHRGGRNRGAPGWGAVSPL